jgi:hypothetical protein
MTERYARNTHTHAHTEKKKREEEKEEGDVPGCIRSPLQQARAQIRIAEKAKKTTAVLGRG